MGSFAPALILALAAGLPTLAWAIYRSRKLGPKEEDELIARSASQAVEAMSSVLDAARRERSELVQRLERSERRVRHLEGELREARKRITRLERATGGGEPASST